MMHSDESCYCDLAALYALDVLDEQERQLVEAELARFPELAEELSALESSAAALSYSAPPAEMPANLKDRLFQRLELGTPPETVIPSSAFAVKAQDLNWRPHPTPGVEIAILHRDFAKRQRVGMLRAAPGVRYPVHRHAGVEELFMLEGDLNVDGVVYGAGDYIRSNPGSVHAPTTEGGCRFLFHASMDDDYFNGY
jgi:anti-sigma factor ChrR (cupin superfamily)